MFYTSKIVIAKGVRITGSVIHFTFQTAADLVLEAEVKSLKMLDVYDLSYTELKMARSERTEHIQYKLKEAPKNTLRCIRAIKKTIFKNSLNVEPLNTQTDDKI